ncbi:MAG: hypothetical protein Alpg2KO_32230 [Alphaproteobacteria bacterium]
MPSENMKKWMPFWRKLTDVNGVVVVEGFAMFPENLIAKVERKGEPLQALNLSGMGLTGMADKVRDFSDANMDDVVAGPRAPLTRYLVERARGAEDNSSFPMIPPMAGVDFADFSESDLSRVTLRNACLNLAILRGADMRDANMAGASLIAADLRDANLDGADFNGVKVSAQTLFSPGQLRKAKNLHQAIVVGLDGRVKPGQTLTADGISMEQSPRMG